MKKNKFYTPDGFTDTLPAVCAFKKESEEKLRKLFGLHGYSEIETPGIEYTDIYTTPSFVREEDLYKMVDQKGRLICARYDGTIPAARFAATLYKDEPLPLRLSYIENMYRFGGAGGGKQAEFTQCGVELMGAAAADSDAEVIALAIRSALEVGIEALQISIGQVKLFSGLKKQMGLDDETGDIIRKAIEERDSVTIEKTAAAKNLSKEDTETLKLLVENGSASDIIAVFEQRVTEPEAIEALKNLKEIVEIIGEYGYEKYVSVDLGLLGSEDYYTGMIFKGFTYEVGFPIISGGRYDNTVGAFGRSMDCVGFSLSLTLAITALMRQGLKLEAPVAQAIVGYNKEIEGARAAAIALASQLREDGASVIFDSSCMSEDELNAYSEARGITATFYVENNGEEE